MSKMDHNRRGRNHVPPSAGRASSRHALGLGLAMSLLVAVVLGGFAIPSHSHAQAPTESAPTEAASQEYTVLQERPDRLIARLPNRMLVIAQEVPTAPVASAQVWVKTGSIYEQEHVGAGLSHFLEHLLSGGTTSTRSEAEASAILGRIGARTNAATSLDDVRYYIDTPAEHADTAVALLSDWMQNSLITEAEYQRERQVIQNEFSKGRGEPGRILWKLTQQARYTAHPARHPTIGYLDQFMEVSREQIHDFYKRMYVPNNMVLVVSGDIDKERAVEQVAELWSDVGAGDLPELSFPVEPEISEPRTQTGHADIDRPRLRLAWPGTQLAGEGDYALDLLAVILGQGESSRLVQTVRNEQQRVTNISAFNLSFPWGKGFFGVDAEVVLMDPAQVRQRMEEEGGTVGPFTPDTVREYALEQVKQAVAEQIERLRNEPVSEEELARAKRKVLANVVSSGQTAHDVASRVASDTIGMGDPDYLAKYAQRIQDITADELQAAAKRFLTPNRLITINLLPQPEGAEPQPITRPADLTTDGRFEQTPVELDNAAVLAELERNLSTPSEEAEPIEVGPIVQYELDNGLRLLVQRSTVVPSVAMQMYWKGGLLGGEPEQAGLANAMAAMMMRGTKQYSADELAQAVENLGADLDTGSGYNTTYIQGQALTEDWPTVLGLMAEVVLQPTFPEQEWQRMQPRLLAAIDRQGDSWYGELTEQFRKAYFGEHPWSQTPLGNKDLVQSLTAEDLARYHRQHLGAEQTVIAVVGDVDPEQVREQVEAQFANLPRQANGKFQPPQPENPEAKIFQTPTAKPLTAVTIGFGPIIDRSHPDYPALEVVSRLMSNFPVGWLDRALRGDGRGLVYADWAQVVTGLVPGYFGITFNTSAENTPEALERAMAVVERAKTGRITEQDLQRAKANVLAGEFFARQSNPSRATSAALDELYGVEDPTGERFRQRVQALTVEDLRTAAKQYLRHPVVVVLSAEQIPTEQLEVAVKGEVNAEPAATTQPAR